MKRHLVLCVVFAAGSSSFIAGCPKSQSENSPPEAAAPAMAAPTTPAPTAPTPAAVPAMAPSVAPTAAAAADARDTELGALIREISAAMLHAARGEPVDSRWIAHDTARSAARLTVEHHQALAMLGPNPTLVLAEVEIGAIARPGPGEHHHVMAHAIMLPDGTIRWGTVASREAEGALLDPTPGLSTSAPPFAAASTRMIEALRSSCTLPWLADSDIASVPTHLRSEFVTELTTTHAACAQVQGVHGEWRPHVDDIRVLVQGNNQYGFLHSVFDVETAGDGGSRIVLSPLRIDVAEAAAH